jgi:hypothetical protein
VISTKLDQRGVSIRDLPIWGTGFDSTSGGGGATGYGIGVRLLANVYIDNVNVLGGGNGFSLEESANIHVTNCTATVHTGEWTGGQQYGVNVRGTAFLFCTACTFYGPRHAVSHVNRFAPSHTCIYANCVIGAPGTNIFLQPVAPIVDALDWHEGTFHTKCIGCDIQGGVVTRGCDMELIGCTIDNARTAHDVALIQTGLSMRPDLRVIGCKLFCRRIDFRGGGMLIRIGGEFDAGEPGSVVLSDNDIYVLHNSTQSIIEITNPNVLNPATGTFHIMNNRVAHSACSTSQPFVNCSWTDGREVVIANNVLPNNVTFGTVGTDFTRRVLSPNYVNGHVVYTGLPTANPGGSGRLWSDSGTLKVT